MKPNVKRILTAIVVVISASLASAQAPLPNKLPGGSPEIPRPPIPRVGVPDLAAVIVAAGPVEMVNGAAEQPITVDVRNPGRFDVGKFKVSVEYKRRGFDQLFVAQFRVPGQPNDTYPWVESLAQGGSVQLTGRLRFDPGVQHERVSIRALADSCVNEGGMPDWCRVRESDEVNNQSAPRLVAFP